MENTKVNSNVFIKFISFLRSISWIDRIVLLLFGGLVCLMIIVMIDTIASGIQNNFFTDSILLHQDNLLGEYSDEIRNHNIKNFYDASYLINTDTSVDVVDSLHIYQMSDNHHVEKFSVANIPIALNVLKIHKNKDMNNSDYLVDLTYVFKKDNLYGIQHQTVLMKTHDLYYLENNYAEMLMNTYQKIHDEYALNQKIITAPSQEMQSHVSQTFDLLNSDVQLSKKKG